MRSSTSAALSFFAFAVTQASALAIPAENTKRSAYPFNKLVAFGDELSDNGNGSYAHGITGDPANVYGFGTYMHGYNLLPRARRFDSGQGAFLSPRRC